MLDPVKEWRKIKHTAHQLALEAMYFEEFVFSSLGVEKDYRGFFDGRSVGAVCIDETNEIYDDPCFFEIKYTNNPEVVLKSVLRNLKHLDGRLIVISLLSDDAIKRLKESIPENVVLKGKSFISDLVKKNKEKWWIFVSSCSPSGTVFYDEKNKAIRIDCDPPLAAVAIGLDVSLEEKRVDQLSVVGENAFKTLAGKGRERTIIIGNGVSAHFGSDLWNSLSDSLFDYLSPRYVDDKKAVKKAIGDTTYSCTSMAKLKIDSSKYYDAIRNSIYRKYEADMHTDDTLVRSIVKIKEKDLGVELISYNYDSFVELDYAKAKNGTSPVLSAVYSKTTDNKTIEPKVKHVHGYLPFKGAPRKMPLVLTQEDYYNSYSKRDSWTYEVQKNALENNVVLFVGSSMSDIFQMSVIEEVRKEHLKKKQNWRCFALICLKDMSARDIAAIFNYYNSKGIHVIFEKSFDKLPGKLLSLF